MNKITCLSTRLYLHVHLYTSIGLGKNSKSRVVYCMSNPVVPRITWIVSFTDLS